MAGLYPVSIVAQNWQNVLCILIINAESKPTVVGVTMASKQRQDFIMFFAVKVPITTQNSHHMHITLLECGPFLKSGALLYFYTVLRMYKNTPPVCIHSICVLKYVC